MGLVVLNPGLGATVQDLGRTGYRAWGVPIGGAFDLGAFAMANALLGNPPEAAAVELTLVGGVYEAREPLAIALAGAPMIATVEAPGGASRTLTIPQTATLRPGERLILGGAARGVRTYLAVRGGWLTPVVLGSRSSEQRLAPGDRLPARPATTPVRRPAESSSLDPDDGPIRFVDGPDVVGPPAWEGGPYRVDPRSDRMGLRLEGPAPPVAIEPERLSTPVAPGAVQVAGGRLIVLGVACGTMGGYPHVGQVLAADLDRLAQARPGATLRLERVSLVEARRIDHADRRARAARRLRLATLAADATPAADGTPLVPAR